MDFSRSESPDGPSLKRIKLNTPVDDDGIAANDLGEELDGDHCSICLQLLLDRTVIPECSHEFCFECIVTWSEQSRRCPLCTRTIGPYLIHNIRSNFDFQKYHLPPLRSSPPPIQPLRRRASLTQRSSARERRWGRRGRREQDVADELERAIDRRRWIYQNHLYAKHVGSNRSSRYRPFPTPAQFAASQDYISRSTVFIRRELRVWPNLDVEFLTTFIISLMKVIDIRAESAIKLLAEFLDMDHPYLEGCRFPNAEHFAHELYSFLRSPYKSLSAYDMSVQYDEARDTIIRGVDNGDKRSEVERRTSNAGARRYSRTNPLLLDGSDPSRPNLSAPNTSDRIGQDSSGPSSFPDVEKSGTRRMHREEGPSELSSDENSSSTPKAGVSLGAPNEVPPGNNASTSNGHPASYGQGRSAEGQITKELEPEDLATGFSHMPSHSHVPTHNNQLSHHQDDGEVEGRQYSGNGSASTEKHHSHKQGNSSSQRLSYQNSTRSTGLLRTRNPLIIAQAHLSEGQDKRKLDRPHLPAKTNTGNPPELRRLSQSSISNRASLLSRISEATGSQTNGSATEVPEAPLTEDESIKPVNVDSATAAAKLQHRVEIARAARDHDERVQGDGLSISSPAPQSTSAASPSAVSNSTGNDFSGPAEKCQTADLEAKARARARLKMKLTIEKHLSSSFALPDNVEVRNSEEKTTSTVSREGMLRAVLENRRRGG